MNTTKEGAFAMSVKNNPQTPSPSTTKTLSTDINAFKQKFRVHHAEYVCFGRKTVHEAWFAGEALNAIKDRLPHGEFRLFLETEGVNRETARRLMLLARETEMAKLLSFGSVDAALKSLSANTPNLLALSQSEPSRAGEKEVVREINLAFARFAESEVEVGKALCECRDDGYSVDEMCDSGDLPFGRDVAYRYIRIFEENCKLAAIKRDMVDGKPVKDILAQHFGRAVQTNLGVKDRG